MKKVIRLNKRKIMSLLAQVSGGMFGVNRQLAEMVADSLIFHQDEIIEEVIQYDDGEAQEEP